MRILYLSTSGCMGGAETSLLSLLEGLRDLRPGWELYLLAAEDGPLVPLARTLGIAVRVLPFPRELANLGDRSDFHGLSLRSALRTLDVTLRYRRELRNAIREIHPDVIHTNGFKMHVLAASIPAGGSAGGSRICHIHEYVTGRRSGAALMKFCSRRFDALVANSRSVAADLMKHVSPRPGKMISIYNGVSLTRFRRHGLALDLDTLAGLPRPAEGVLRIGMPATFARWKGHFTFLRSLALLPASLNIRAYVIGGPIYQTAGSQYSLAELQAEASRLGLGDKIGFTGFIEDMPAALRALDMVVHTSTSPEPFGMVVIEAMACAKPVIVSSGGGAAELFEDGVTGLAHRSGDVSDLAAQIERLARDPELRRRMGTNARASVAARFQAADMAKRFAELYYRVTLENGFTKSHQAGERCFASH